jgi:hypothetical protein
VFFRCHTRRATRIRRLLPAARPRVIVEPEKPSANRRPRNQTINSTPCVTTEVRGQEMRFANRALAEAMCSCVIQITEPKEPSAYPRPRNAGRTRTSYLTTDFWDELVVGTIAIGEFEIRGQGRWLQHKLERSKRNDRLGRQKMRFADRALAEAV